VLPIGSELPQEIWVFRAIPIGSNLTESTFADNIDEIDNAIQLARAELRLLIGSHPEE